MVDSNMLEPKAFTWNSSNLNCDFDNGHLEFDKVADSLFLSIPFVYS